ncbi:MAG: ABC transporter permease [Rectinemataceae bacterium]
MRFLRTLGFAALLLLIVLAVAAALVIAVRADPGKAASGFLRGAFGSFYSISEVLVRATPLILAGLGVSIGFRTGFFNIGAEGQIYLGATAATAVGLLFPGLPAPVMLPLALLCGFAGGGLWSAVPGFLKSRFGLSEVITTIMFNYIAINVVGILVRSVMKDPSYPLPMSPDLPEAMRLPAILEPTRLHLGLVIALASALGVWFLMSRTLAGFRMRAVGLNPRASLVAGISVPANLLLASALSGGFAGLAGASEITGIHHRLLEGISPGFGYVAIIAALLGRNHPGGIVIASLGIAALQVGSSSMQRASGVPSSISWIIMGVLVLLILARRPIGDRIAGGAKGVR